MIRKTARYDIDDRQKVVDSRIGDIH
jgi:hypothetical protein